MAPKFRTERISDLNLAMQSPIDPNIDSRYKTFITSEQSNNKSNYPKNAQYLRWQP